MVTSCIRESAAWMTLLVVVAVSGLSGCGEAENSGQETAPLPSAPPAADMSPPSSTSEATGLIPLPTSQQVLSSVPEGRKDPFAPTVDASTPSSSSQSDPDTSPTTDFRVQGVVDVGGELRALVSIAEASGTVCVGPRGRCPGDAAALLPIGWAVQSIDLGRGCLSLSISGQSQRRCIA